MNQCSKSKRKKGSLKKELNQSLVKVMLRFSINNNSKANSLLNLQRFLYKMILIVLLNKKLKFNKASQNHQRRLSLKAKVNFM